jgi:hypothetical protein
MNIFYTNVSWGRNLCHYDLKFVNFEIIVYLESALWMAGCLKVDFFSRSTDIGFLT